MVEIILVSKDTKWFHLLMFCIFLCLILDFRTFWDELGGPNTLEMCSFWKGCRVYGKGECNNLLRINYKT